jgi:hypothetical protein
MRLEFGLGQGTSKGWYQKMSHEVEVSIRFFEGAFSVHFPQKCLCMDITYDCDVCSRPFQQHIRFVSCKIHGGDGYMTQVYCPHCLIDAARRFDGPFAMIGTSPWRRGRFY